MRRIRFENEDKFVGVDQRILVACAALHTRRFIVKCKHLVVEQSIALLCLGIRFPQGRHLGEAERVERVAVVQLVGLGARSKHGRQCDEQNSQSVEQ